MEPLIQYLHTSVWTTDSSVLTFTAGRYRSAEVYDTDPVLGQACAAGKTPLKIPVAVSSAR
jgi:hypothetical protein